MKNSIAKEFMRVAVLIILVIGIGAGLSPRVGHTQNRKTESFVSLSQQGLIDIQEFSIKALDIDLRRPRLLKNIDNVSFDSEGAKQARPFIGLNSTLDSEVLEVPSPLQSVSLTWSGANGVSQNVRGYLRSSQNLSAWSEWIPLESAGSEFCSATLFESLGVFVPAESKYIQFRLEFLNSIDGTSVDRVTLNYTALADRTSGREDDGLTAGQPTQLSATRGLTATAAGVSAPKIITRTDWGCPEGESAPLAPPDGNPNTPVTNLIVHHTLLGTRPKNPNDYKTWVLNIWKEQYYRVNLDGSIWGDVGYNLLIDPQGNVYEGRAGGVDAKGFHFSCHNSHTTGIALLGDFTTSLPTTKALTALKQVLAWRAQAWGIDPKINSILYSPLSTIPALDIPSIAGHRDSNPITWSCPDTDARTCPGDALYGLLPSIRNDVAQMLPPGFALQIQSNSKLIFLTQGQQASVGVNLDSYGSLSGTASISATGLPPGMSVTSTTVYVPANGNVSAVVALKSSLATSNRAVFRNHNRQLGRNTEVSESQHHHSRSTRECHGECPQ